MMALPEWVLERAREEARAAPELSVETLALVASVLRHPASNKS